jgi:hypothetical protein
MVVKATPLLTTSSAGYFASRVFKLLAMCWVAVSTEYCLVSDLGYQTVTICFGIQSALRIAAGTLPGTKVVCATIVAFSTVGVLTVTGDVTRWVSRRQPFSVCGFAP